MKTHVQNNPKPKYLMIRQDRKQKALRKALLMKRFHKAKNRNKLAQPGPFSYVLILDNLKPDFNIGKILRSADAFGAHEIHIIGTTYFDPAPAQGSFRWVPTTFYEDFQSCYQLLEERSYTFFAMEPEAKEPLQKITLPEKAAFILGHEEFGLQFEKEDYPDIQFLKILQYGKVQSLNVSVAASVIMYEYIRQFPNPMKES